jgi:WD40 repeat protein
VRLWNLRGQELVTLKGHIGGVRIVVFSPDAKTIASSSEDYTVKLWNFDLDNLLALSCAWVNDYFKYNRYVKDEDRKLCDDIDVSKR